MALQPHRPNTSPSRRRLVRERSHPTGGLPGRPFPTISWWWLMSILAVGLMVGIGGLAIIRYLARPMALLILAMSIAAALAPVVERLEKHMPRALAVILVYILLVLIIISILASTVPLLTHQVTTLIDQAARYMPTLSNWLAQFGFNPALLRSSFLTYLGQLTGMLFRLPLNLFSVLLEFALIVFMSLYWLLLMPNLKRFALSFFPVGETGFINRILGEMGTGMGGYLRGSAINGLIIGIAEYIALTIIGIPFALTLGSLAGLMEFFPTIGPIISGTLAVLVAFSVSPNAALVTLAMAIILQQTEGHILVPLIMRSQASISPLLAIFAVVAGAAIGGLLGAVIAIPVASILHVLVTLVIAPAVRKANGVEAVQEDPPAAGQP